MENYCSICGRPLNENGFCDDPECNIPNGFNAEFNKAQSDFVNKRYVSSINCVSTIEPTWENNNFE